jgi:hypothetical protein
MLQLEYDVTRAVTHSEARLCLDQWHDTRYSQIMMTPRLWHARTRIDGTVAVAQIELDHDDTRNVTHSRARLWWHQCCDTRYSQIMMTSGLWHATTRIDGTRAVARYNPNSWHQNCITHLSQIMAPELLHTLRLEHVGNRCVTWYSPNMIAPELWHTL